MTTAKTLAADALTDAVALRDLLEDEGTTWSVERVERRIASVRADIQAAITALRSTYGVAAHNAVDGLMDVALALVDLGIAVNANRVRMIAYTVPRPGSAALVAWWLYQDVSRRDEIIELNRLPDPNRVSAGTVLRVLAA